MIQNQLDEFECTLNIIGLNYTKLVKKRYSYDLTRDEYMIYDMMDMFIALQSVIIEAASDHIDSGYMIEKLSKIKSYVDNTLEYYNKKES